MTLFSRKRLITFIIALVLLMSSLAAGAEGLSAYASVSDARVFNGAGQVVGTVSLNTAVNVLAVRDGVCLVEWADMVRELLPPETIRVTITRSPGTDMDERHIVIQGKTL